MLDNQQGLISLLIISLIFLSACSLTTRPNPDAYNSRILSAGITSDAQFQLSMSPAPEDIINISLQPIQLKLLVNNFGINRLDGIFRIWTNPNGDRYAGVRPDEGFNGFNIDGINEDKQSSNEIFFGANTESVNFYGNNLQVFGEVRYRKEGNLVSDNVCLITDLDAVRDIGLIKDLNRNLKQECNIDNRLDNQVTVVSNGAGYITTAHFEDRITDKLKAKTSINNFKLKFTDENSDGKIDSLIIDFLINEGNCDIISIQNSQNFEEVIDERKLEDFFPDIQINFEPELLSIGKDKCILDKTKSTKNQKAIKCVVSNEFNIEVYNPNQKINIGYDYGCRVNLQSNNIVFIN